MRAAVIVPLATSAAAMHAVSDSARATSGCVRPGTCTPPPAKYSRVAGSPQPRRQWEISGGFCGAFSVQNAALAKGAWISQDLVRKANTHGEGHGDAEQGYEVLPSNVGETAKNLKLAYDEWDYTQPKPQIAAYKAWLKKNLAGGNAVVWFPMCKGDGQMIPYPDSNPNGGRFSHVEPVWGIYSNHSLDDLTVYDDDVLFHGSDQDTAPYYRAFSTLEDTEKMQGNCKHAFGIPGRNEMYPCIYDQVDYGLAVTGLGTATTAGGVSVSLVVDLGTSEPNVRNGAKPVALHGTVTVEGLSAGTDYVLYRYNSTATFPSDPATSTPFTAKAATYTFEDPVTFQSNGATYYRAAPSK